MRMSADAYDEYSGKLSAQQRAARVYVETALRAFRRANPDASDEEFREFGIDTMTSAFQRFGDQAAVVACEQYDRTARELGHSLPAAEIANDVDPKQVESSVRYFMREVTYGDFDAFVSRMSAKAYDHVMRSANATTIHNAERPADRRAGMRYARVPTGRETCGFCLMLASRGFDYKTRASAGDVGGGAFNRFHDNCDCRVVAGDETTEIEGYDPEWYMSVYRDARETVGDRLDGEDSRSYTNRVVNEINRRNGSWSWDGTPGKTTMDEGARPLPKESSLAGILNNHGFDVHFRATRSDEGKHTSDVFLSGTQRWEFKQPVGNGKQTIYHQFEEAALQSRRLVIDIRELESSDLVTRWDRKTVGAAVERYLHWRFKNGDSEETEFIEALVVGNGGYMRRYK